MESETANSDLCVWLNQIVYVDSLLHSLTGDDYCMKDQDLSDSNTNESSQGEWNNHNRPHRTAYTPARQQTSSVYRTKELFHERFLNRSMEPREIECISDKAYSWLTAHNL